MRVTSKVKITLTFSGFSVINFFSMLRLPGLRVLVKLLAIMLSVIAPVITPPSGVTVKLASGASVTV